MAFGLAQAQSGQDVLLVNPDGSRSEFTLATTSDGSVRVIHWTGRGGPSQGNVVGVDDSTFTTIPVNLIARANLERPFRQTVWIWQLKDGRSLASPALLDSVSLTIIGVDEFGIHQTLESYPRRPDSQPFIGIIFDDAE
ncbi:MAG: hypothetical protein LC667_01690 [Thioalkalivibrio sp.]|nr:hypothetical protein [Thioalkalivibrio sp.]